MGIQDFATKCSHYSVSGNCWALVFKGSGGTSENLQSVP